MSALQPFNPRWGSNQLLTAAAASASATLSGNTKQIRATNTGATNPVYIRTGNSANGTVTATTADLRISPGVVVVFTKPQSDDSLAYISASGTTLEIIEGEGWL